MATLRKKFPIITSNPLLAIFCSFSIVFLVFSVIVLLLNYSFSGVEVVKAEETKPIQDRSKLILEVHIASTGLVFLQGAKVESIISSSSFVVSTSWSNTVLSWIINTNESYYDKRHFGTDFLDSRGVNVSMSDISVGDYISVSGVLDTKSIVPTVKADVVRVSS